MLASKFSERNHALLHELFALLGLTYSADPVANARLAMDKWYGEHREAITEYSHELLQRIITLATAMGMIGQHIPAVFAPLSRMNNPGGRVRAMLKRFRLYEQLEGKGFQMGELITWAGQRLRDTKSGSGECLLELIELIENERPELFMDSWVKGQLGLDNTNPDPWERPFATETEIVILCTKIVYGNRVRLEHAVPIEEISEIEGVPARSIQYYRFTRIGGPDFIVFNGAAVKRQRPDGTPMTPQPTTHSTALEVAEEFGFDGVQGIMLSNPHAERQAQEIDHFAREAGYDPTFVVFELEGAPMRTDEQIARATAIILGEIARILRNELEHVRMSA